MDQGMLASSPVSKCSVLDLSKSGEKLGKSSEAMRKLIARGRIKAIKAKNGRWFIDVSEIDNFLNRRSEG